MQAGEEKYNHLDAAEVGKVEKAIAEKSDWYNRWASFFVVLAIAVVFGVYSNQKKDFIENLASCLSVCSFKKELKIF